MGRIIGEISLCPRVPHLGLIKVTVNEPHWLVGAEAGEREVTLSHRLAPHQGQ